MQVMPRKAPLGPHSRAPAFAAVDGRSEAGRLLSSTKRELVQHLGGKPSATQRLLIERAASYRLRLALLDAKALAGEATPTDERWFGHWASGLARIMRDLGLEAAPVARKTLAEHVAQRRGGGP